MSGETEKSIMLDELAWREIAKLLESTTPEYPGPFVALKVANAYHAKCRAINAIRNQFPKRRARRAKSTDMNAHQEIAHDDLTINRNDDEDRFQY